MRKQVAMVGDTKEGDGMSTAGFSQIAGLECIQSEKITSRRKKPDERATVLFSRGHAMAKPRGSPLGDI
jgi:hypothetical protein